MIHRLATLLCLLALPVFAQQEGRPNAVLLVAKPHLQDPNFRRTVVLATQAEDGSTVGVILNRPTGAKDAQTGETLYFGGPVMRQVTVAVFRAREMPKAAAFPVLKGVYLSMHPANIEALQVRRDGSYRLYSGFSGWAPRQLESEMVRDGWYLLPATEDLVFRGDTQGLWQELVERAAGGKRPHVRSHPRGYTFSHEASAAPPPRRLAPGV